MKLKNMISRIPRPVKACTCAVVAILLAAVLYIAWGCPTLTLEQEFRRAEKAHLVGPSTIVDTVYYEDYREFDKLIVGETEYGICFFGKYFTNSSERGLFADYEYRFNYIPKTGDITVAAAPNIFGVHWYLLPGETLPVYVFTESQDAVRAELEFIVSAQMRNSNPDYSYQIPYTVTFKGEATRAESGMFRFLFQSATNEESHALGQFSSIYPNNSLIPRENDMAIPVTVRLYDAGNNLIAQETLTLESTRTIND